jgi:coenzyme Q-binding protein COQ10
MGSARSKEVIEINVAREDFRKVLSDYEAYPEFLDELQQVKILSQTGETFRVQYFVSILGREISYTLDLTHVPPGRVQWTLVKGDFMKNNVGSWTLDELGDKRIRATYEIEMGFPMLVPGAVVSQLQKTGLPKMLAAFKARAEQLYG